MARYHTTAARNLMLDALDGDAPGSSITHVSAYELAATVESVVGEADNETFTKNAHGLVDGTVVGLNNLAGGTGLSEDQWYFIINDETNTFQLSLTPGGSAVAFSTDVTDVDVVAYTEITGGSYARQAIAFNAAADGALDDSTNGADIPIPGGNTVAAIGQHSADSAGTLFALDEVTPEAFAGDGTYRVTDVDHTLTPAA